MPVEADDLRRHRPGSVTHRPAPLGRPTGPPVSRVTPPTVPFPGGGNRIFAVSCAATSGTGCLRPAAEAAGRRRKRPPSARYGGRVTRRFALHIGGSDEVIESLDRIDREIIQLFALVGEGVAGATHSLLAGDREAARVLADSDEMIDTLYREVEQLAQQQLAQRATGPEELRYLVAVLRMLPELERSGDLAEHVSRRAVRGLGIELSPRARGLVEQMGEVASEMWRATADAYGDRSPDVAEQVEALDDELDELHVTLTAEIASGSMPLPVAIEAALVARFYERFGDHAVNLARRIAALAGRSCHRSRARPALPSHRSRSPSSAGGHVEERLGDLHGVQRRPLAQVVAGHEQGQAVLARSGRRRIRPTNESDRSGRGRAAWARRPVDTPGAPAAGSRRPRRRQRRARTRR